MGTEEGKELQVKGICNIFNNIITENFPNEKILLVQVQEASRILHRLAQNKTSPKYIIKTTSLANRERILKAAREKKKSITCKGKLIKITSDFSMETLKARMA
jgi:hypothetical protein